MTSKKDPLRTITTVFCSKHPPADTNLVARLHVLLLSRPPGERLLEEERRATLDILIEESVDQIVLSPSILTWTTALTTKIYEVNINAN